MPGIVLGVLLGLGAIAGAAFAYYGNDRHLSVGYSPVQPVDYSHKLHAGDLGMDCRYCHSTVESSSFAAVPATQVCMNCHSMVRANSPKILPVRESYAANKPIPWVQIHRLPDYVYFDHSAHLAAGVGCASCHGRVDQMPRVEQVESLSMGWCLDCHRNPEPHLRDAADVTKMDWVPRSKTIEDTTVRLRTNEETKVGGAAAPPAVKGSAGGRIATARGRVVSPPIHCSGCHR